MPRLTAVLALLSAATISGCAMHTAGLKTEFTDFEPTEQGFRYRGLANAIYEIDTEDGEAWRMEILQSYLTDNDICPKGYEITSRKPVVVNGKGGSVYWVHYQGRCK
jgi:hypothetical protein